MNDLDTIRLKSVDIIKQLFNIEDECAILLSKKPRVSRNVRQAYHKDIMGIALEYKQMFLDIVDRKKKFVSAILQLKDELQSEQGHQEQQFEECSLSIDELKKSVDLGEREKKQLEEEISELDELVKEKRQFKVDFQAIREKQESDISLLQNQITHFQSTLDGLQNDQTQLEQQIETLTNQLKEHEISVETCVSVLEEKYAKQHKDLIDQVERDQAAFQQLKQDIATKNAEYQQTINQIEQTIKDLKTRTTEFEQQNEQSLQEISSLEESIKSISEEQDKKKQQVAILDTQLEDSKEKIDQLTSQQHEMEQFYNKRIEDLSEKKSRYYDDSLRVSMKRIDCEGEKQRVEISHQKLVDQNKKLKAEIESLEKQKNDLVIEELSSQRSLQEDKQTLESKEQQIAALEEEIKKLVANLHDRNEEFTAELNQLTSQYETLKEQVSSRDAYQLKERQQLDEELRILEEKHNQLYSKNVELKTEYANVQEMRSSTTKNSQNRINQLQKSIDQLKTEIQNTADIETRYQLQNEKIQNLDSKVIRSENARRIISNRIQDIKGNISCFAVLSPSLHPGSSCLEVTPDETKIMMRNPIGKMIGYSYDRVFGGNFENEEIVETLSDLFYTVLDGKTITLLNYSVESLNSYKRQLLFDCSSHGILHQTITLLYAHTQRLLYLQQEYHFYLSIVELDASSIGHALHSSFIDDGVSENDITDEPEIHDLLEIARFSMDINNQNVHRIKRREIRTQEDLDDLLALISQKQNTLPVKEMLTTIVTLTVEGGQVDSSNNNDQQSLSQSSQSSQQSSQQTIGQIHFCDIVGLSSLSQSLQEQLIGVIPAVSLLYSSTSPFAVDNEELSNDYSSLQTILTRLCHNGKLAVLSSYESTISNYDETGDLLNYIQRISECRLKPSVSRFRE